MKAIIEIREKIRTHWVGDGFPVKTMFSYAGDTQLCSPFLLLDYAGPHIFEPSSVPRGVGEHPHRGFQTVSIIYQGELEHRDSSGHQGILGPGDVQWMSAGQGVVHEEFHSQSFTKDGGPFEMVQLWVNLPAAQKMSPATYQDIRAEAIPQIPLEDGVIRVIAGTYGQHVGPAKTETSIQILDLKMGRGFSTSLGARDGNSAILLVRSGKILVNEKEILTAGELAIFDHKKASIHIQVQETFEGLFLCGEPIEEPVVGHGPFVMNSEAEIIQAVQDYREGKMGKLVDSGN